MDKNMKLDAINRVKKYIKNHGAPDNIRFDANVREIFAMAFGLHPVDGVDLAFLYGKAKGYQQAKKELQKKSA